MTKWDIQPDGVRTALNNTGETAGKFGEEFTAYSDGLVASATAAGTMILGGTKAPEGGAFGPVAQALQEFQQHTENDLKFLVVRAGKSIKGAREATEEYLKGDEQMAQNKQHLAAQAPTPEEFKAAAEKGGKS